MGDLPFCGMAVLLCLHVPTSPSPCPCSRPAARSPSCTQFVPSSSNAEQCRRWERLEEGVGAAFPSIFGILQLGKDSLPPSPRHTPGLTPLAAGSGPAPASQTITLHIRVPPRTPSLNEAPREHWQWLWGAGRSIEGRKVLPRPTSSLSAGAVGACLHQGRQCGPPSSCCSCSRRRGRLTAPSPRSPAPSPWQTRTVSAWGRGQGSTDWRREGTGLGGLGCNVSWGLTGHGAVCDAVSVSPSWCPQM